MIYDFRYKILDLRFNLLSFIRVGRIYHRRQGCLHRQDRGTIKACAVISSSTAHVQIVTSAELTVFFNFPNPQQLKQLLQYEYVKVCLSQGASYMLLLWNLR